MEGVVAKVFTSKSGNTFLNIGAAYPNQTFIGWIPPASLLLGAYRDGKLHYFGHSGSGFTEKGLKEAVARLKPFFTNKSPFENPPKIPEKVQWVEPVFVCEVAFAEWTLDGELRQTTFLEWRDDKAPKELVLSQPLPG
jgi:bifunctional non-homologous end joining protein LigD